MGLLPVTVMTDIGLSAGRSPSGTGVGSLRSEGGCPGSRSSSSFASPNIRSNMCCVPYRSTAPNAPSSGPTRARMGNRRVAVRVPRKTTSGIGVGIGIRPGDGRVVGRRRPGRVFGGGDRRRGAVRFGGGVRGFGRVPEMTISANVSPADGNDGITGADGGRSVGGGGGGGAGLGARTTTSASWELCNASAAKYPAKIDWSSALPPNPP
jgi:hypothetical protein